MTKSCCIYTWKQHIVLLLKNILQHISYIQHIAFQIFDLLCHSLVIIILLTYLFNNLKFIYYYYVYPIKANQLMFWNKTTNVAKNMLSYINKWDNSINNMA